MYGISKGPDRKKYFLFAQDELRNKTVISFFAKQG
jgi:hypothetical protein